MAPAMSTLPFLCCCCCVLSELLAPSMPTREPLKFDPSAIECPARIPPKNVMTKRTATTTRYRVLLPMPRSDCRDDWGACDLVLNEELNEEAGGIVLLGRD